MGMLPLPLVAALLSIGLAGASPGGDGDGDVAALLSGRLLGPRHHVRLTARLQLADQDQDQGAGRHPRAVCLRVDKGPPLFKFALPAESEDGRRLADAADADAAAFNCSASGDPAVEALLKSLDFSSGNLQRSLCNGAAALLRHYATGAPGPSQGVLKTQCTPTANSAAVSLRGRLDDEQVAASLQLRQLRHGGRARAVPRTGAMAEEAGGQQRSRRAHGNEADELQRCVAEGYSLAVPADVGGDVILVLGLTGSGKSTLVQFIANNDENLVSYETTADSGDFLIGDYGNKIASGVDSKTRVPELVRDTGSKSKLYDFPGFGDSRGACADIVTASVLRQVAQSARSVKVVFVISYHSARAGSDRLGFVSLLRHATTFVRDLAKYKDSVALVVTKVPADDVDEDSISESAAEVRETVASFLRQVKETLVDLERTGSDPADFYPGADAMVSAILQQEDDGAYGRIGVFWKPDEAGPLRNITLMQESKPDLQNMIYRLVAPTEPEDDDFGLALSPKAKVEVERLAVGFASRLQGHIERIARALRAHYQSTRLRLLDVAAVRDQTERDAEHFAAALDRVVMPAPSRSAVGVDGDPRTPRGFLRRLLDAVRDVHQQAPADGFLASLNDTVMLEFLQDASREEQNYRPEEWAQPLRRVGRYLRGVQLWYALLEDLEKALSQDVVQRDREGFLGQLGLPTAGQPKRRARGPADGTGQLLAALARLGLHKDKRDALKGVEVDEAMAEDLRGVLDAALRSAPATASCEESELVVQGRYVWARDVEQWVAKGCPTAIRTVHVVAEHTLFVDRDLQLRELSKELTLLTIVAPRWHVLGNHFLSVDGVSAKPRPPPTVNGMHGLPGEPGGAAGSILAVAGEVLDGHLLTLHASGGRGGTGQDGAPGRDGLNGPDASTYSGSDSDGEEWNWGLGVFWGSTKERRHGWSAAEGNNGGDGGVGGAGGPAGALLLLGLGDLGGGGCAGPGASCLQPRGAAAAAPALSAVQRVAAEGDRGSNGNGGKGGKGGTHGVDVVVKHKYFLFMNYKDEVMERKYKGDAEQGEDGSPGRFSRGLEPPEPATRVVCVQAHLNRARRLAASALWDRARAGTARRLLSRLDALEARDAAARLEHPDGNSDPEECAPTALLHELADLEQARWQHHQDASTALRLLPRYEALLHRLDAASLTATEIGQVVLAARAATLTSLRALRSPARAELVVNVKGFLEASQRAVRGLAESQRQAVVTAAQRSVHGAIDRKIRERLSLLSEHVQPALLAAASHLRRSVSALDVELRTEKVRVAESKRAVASLQRSLREANLRARILDLMSKLWKAVTSLFTGGMAEQAGVLVDSIEDVADQVDSAMKLVGDARDLYDVVTDETAEVKDISDVMGKVGKITNIVRTTAADWRDLSEKSRQLAEPRAEPRSERLSAAPAPREAERGGRSSSKADHEELMAGLSVREEDLGRREVWLQGAERDVRESLLPLLGAVLDDLRQLRGSRGSRGAWSMSAARAMRLKLRDVRIALSPLSGPAAASTAGSLAVPRELRLCAELLDESLGTLIATLEQLEELRESHETSKSLASVATVLASTTPGSSSFASLHPDVQSGLSRLRETVSGNLVLERYKVGLHGFKQWAFPFAQLYLSNESLSTASASRENAVEIASSGLEHLLGRMEMYHSVVVQGHDTYIRVRSFEEPRALYAWGPEEHAEQLDRLLDGREVALWADVSRSPVREDAVKFDTIGVRFLTTDPGRQADLDRLLGGLLVSMTHMGDSYYKCGSKVFSVSLETQRIEMTVARKADGDGTPVFSNKVYDKLRSGDMMLSPFALWKVRFRAEDGKPLPVELQSFKGGVRLVLEGHAQYVSGFECSEALDEFYTFEPSKSDLNAIII